MQIACGCDLCTQGSRLPYSASAIGRPKEKIRIEPVEVPVPSKEPAPVETPTEVPEKVPA